MFSVFNFFLVRSGVIFTHYGLWDRVSNRYSFNFQLFFIVHDFNMPLWTIVQALSLLSNLSFHLHLLLYILGSCVWESVLDILDTFWGEGVRGGACVDLVTWKVSSVLRWMDKWCPAWFMCWLQELRASIWILLLMWNKVCLPFVKLKHFSAFSLWCYNSYWAIKRCFGTIYFKLYWQHQ